MTRRPIIVATLWYWPSHFGCHVDDMCTHLAAHGWDPVIITVEAGTLAHTYFDPVRSTFVDTNGHHHPWPVVRLPVRELIERGPANPLVVLDDSATARVLPTVLGGAPVLYIFESLVPALGPFGRRSGAIYYAGDFVTRSHALHGLERGRAIDAFLSHLYVGDPGRPSLRDVTAVLCQTRSLAVTLRDRLGVAVEHVRRPLDAEAVRQAALVDVRAELGVPGDARVLIYAGRLAKNAVALLDVLALLSPEVHLLLVGGQRRELGAVSDQIADRLHVRPFVARERLFGWLKTADLLIYPGAVDGWPKVISEAQVGGLPVVAFDAPASAAREIVRHGDTGILVPAGDTRAAARAIERLLVVHPVIAFTHAVSTLPV